MIVFKGCNLERLCLDNHLLEGNWPHYQIQLYPVMARSFLSSAHVCKV